MIADGEATLVISSETMSTAEITAVLGVEPSRTKDRGEPISPRNAQVRRHSTWSLDGPAKTDPDDESGFGTMRSLLELIAESGLAERLDELRESCGIVLDWYGMSDSTQGGFVIPEDVLAGMAALRADFFGTTYLEERPLLRDRLQKAWWSLRYAIRRPRLPLDRRVSEHAFVVAASPRAVFEHLRDPQSYVGLSPLVVEARDVQEEESGLVRYVAVERFGIGPWHYDNRIEVSLRADDGDPSLLIVQGMVRSPGRVRLSYSYRITPEDAGSRVVDRIDLYAPRPIREFAFGKAREVQLARAEILARRLGQPAA